MPSTDKLNGYCYVSITYWYTELAQKYILIMEQIKMIETKPFWFSVLYIYIYIYLATSIFTRIHVFTHQLGYWNIKIVFFLNTITTCIFMGLLISVKKWNNLCRRPFYIYILSGLLCMVFLSSAFYCKISVLLSVLHKWYLKNVCCLLWNDFMVLTLCLWIYCYGFHFQRWLNM